MRYLNFTKQDTTQPQRIYAKTTAVFFGCTHMTRFFNRSQVLAMFSRPTCTLMAMLLTFLTLPTIPRYCSLLRTSSRLQGCAAGGLVPLCCTTRRTSRYVRAVRPPSTNPSILSPLHVHSVKFSEVSTHVGKLHLEPDPQFPDLLPLARVKT